MSKKFEQAEGGEELIDIHEINNKKTPKIKQVTDSKRKSLIYITLIFIIGYFSVFLYLNFSNKNKKVKKVNEFPSGKSNGLDSLNKRLEDLESQIIEIKEENQRLKQENIFLKNEIEQIKKSLEDDSDSEETIKTEDNSQKEDEKKFAKIETLIPESQIIKTQNDFELLNSAFKNTKVFKNKSILDLDFKLIYRLTTDGSKSNNFHAKCDNIENTLIVVKTIDKRKFGGFTTRKWNDKTNGTLVKEGRIVVSDDGNAFVFSLDFQKVFPIINGQKAIIIDEQSGPGFEQILELNGNLKYGYSWTYDKSYFSGLVDAYELNPGNSWLTNSEVEVFQVSLKN